MKRSLGGKPTNLNKEMMKNIDNYSKDISTLEDFVSAVRQMPGMYIGPKGWKGFLNMIREIFQNSLDQLTYSLSPCDTMSVFLDERDHTVIIEDNGLGIPFDDMVRIFTKEHTSKNYKKKPGEYAAGMHGVGAKVTNALSSIFVVESYHYSGEARKLTMIDGRPIKEGIAAIPNPDKRQGTKIMFRPSEEVMGDVDLPWHVLYDLINHILSLTDIGTHIFFKAIDINGKVYEENMVNEDGIVTDLIIKTSNPLCPPILLSEDTGYTKVDLAFCYDSENLGEPNITAFSNFCPTSLGTHIKGFTSGISTWFMSYMNKIYLGPKSKVKVNSNDTGTGLCAMISAAALVATFTGQHKDELSNPEMEIFVKSVVMKGLDQWSKNNPQDLQKTCKYLKEIAEIRQKSDDAKVKIKTKYVKSVLTGMPAKLDDAIGDPRKDELEIIFVEGDSAGGTAKIARCKIRQAVMPLRGKIPNLMDGNLNKILETNEEVQAMITIFGAGYGKNFDITKLRYRKIIIMADADPDGDHIATLLVKAFIVLFPGLIESGMVYKAVPPLYGIMNKNGRMTYFTEKIDFYKFMQKNYSKNNVVKTIYGENISNNKLLDILLKNDDYVYEINCIANRYAIEPTLLELILINYFSGTSTKKMFRNIKDKFKYTKFEEDKKNGVIIIEGLIGDKYNVIYLVKRLIDECDKILPYLDGATTHYNVNGNTLSLYEILNDFEKMISKYDLSRYKGLGEMDSDHLSESTIHPDGERMLQRYTGAKGDIETIRILNSDKKKILSYIGKVTRKQLMD